jgi:hypothetical protein
VSIGSRDAARASGIAAEVGLGVEGEVTSAEGQVGVQEAVAGGDPSTGDDHTFGDDPVTKDIGPVSEDQ